jgi:hypothetical protein
VIFPVLAQSSAIISSKLTKPFPSKLCSLVILGIDIYLLVRSFKSFDLIDALFLVYACLFALYACAQ